MTKQLKISDIEYDRLKEARELIKRRGTDILGSKLSMRIQLTDLTLGSLVDLGSEIIIAKLKEVNRK